jgi:hypothetical protein
MSAAATIIMMSAANKAKACADCVSGEPLTDIQGAILIICMVCLIAVILWVNRK